MTTNRGDMPAMPQSIAATLDGGISLSSEYGCEGMTIRERMSMAAMQGLLAGDGVYNPGDLAIEAVSHADDLLAELERNK